MSKLVFLNCFFGSFPWYFSFFLKSCEYNSSIEFLIFSDAKWNEDLPVNVKIIPFSIQEFNALASTKLNLPIDVREGYKLCDFKPAYGRIFHEYIENFKFWGICDIDIVFGRIREFITDEKLNTFEIISVRNDYPTGSFMVFRNNEKINDLFRKSKDHEKVFTSNKHYCFDECNFKHGFLQYGGDIFSIDCEIESMHHVIKKEELTNDLKVHFDFLIIEGLPGKLKWENGILTFKDEFEILMYHLILFKSNSYTKKNYPIQVPDLFFIDKYQIRSHSTNSIKGKFKKILYDNLIPGFKKYCFRADAKISQTLKVPLRGLASRKIYYADGFLEIGNYEKLQTNWISFNGRSTNDLVRSIIYKENFYIKNFNYSRYSLDISKDQLQRRSFNGEFEHYK